MNKTYKHPGCATEAKTTSQSRNRRKQTTGNNMATNRHMRTNPNTHTPTPYRTNANMHAAPCTKQLLQNACKPCWQPNNGQLIDSGVEMHPNHPQPTNHSQSFGSINESLCLKCDAYMESGKKPQTIDNPTLAN